MAVVEAVVDLRAIGDNGGVLRELSGSAVMAVVKADGYGHGAIPVARAALAAGAAGIGVATVDEALALRAGGIDGPVIAWLHTPTTDFAAAVRHDVEVVVSSPRQLASVVAAADEIGRTAAVGVKVDTGLGRSGVGPDEWPELRDALAKHVASEAVVLRTAMTHLARGDEPGHPLNSRQAELLDDRVAQLRRAGVSPEVVHVSNSAAAPLLVTTSASLMTAGSDATSTVKIVLGLSAESLAV